MPYRGYVKSSIYLVDYGWSCQVLWSHVGLCNICANSRCD